MGYLNGLPKNAPATGNWGANDYGFWARGGDSLVIDGSIEYINGDWLIENDATVKIQTSTNYDIINLGTNAGQKGLFLFDGTASRNLRGEFRADRLFLGSSSNSIEWTPASGLNVTGKVTGSSFIGGSINIGSGKFQVDSLGNLTATSVTITGDVSGSDITGSSFTSGLVTGSTVTGSTVRGGTIETIGGTHMLVTSATPFNGLIQWYGLTAGNLSGGAPIYANLTRANAIRWIDSAGEYSRDIVSRRNTTSTTTVSVTHPSQGSLITILGKGRVTASENFTVFNQPSFSGKITINYRLRKGATQVASGIYSSTLAFNVEQLDPSIWSLEIAFDIPLEIEYEETIGVTSQAYSFDITSVVVEADEVVTPVYKSQITTTEIRQ
jgi:hypothetical protein